MIRGGDNTREHLAHQGELRRVAPEDGVPNEDTIAYALHIYCGNSNNSNSRFGAAASASRYDLEFSRHDFEFCARLFAILDTENQGAISYAAVHEFTTLRCPVFWRRDEDLRKLKVLRQQQQQQQSQPLQQSLQQSSSSSSSSSLLLLSSFTTRNKASTTTSTTSPTFEEIWKSVITCDASAAATTTTTTTTNNYATTRIGVEGWLVVCRFIALAQYLEAKRRFSARHLQQTMRHRNAPRGSEVVVVDVPPPQPPAALTVQALMECEGRTGTPLPVPELDLDHSLLAVHDVGPASRHFVPTTRRGMVQVQLLGAGPLGRLTSHANINNSSSSSSSHNNSSSHNSSSSHSSSHYYYSSQALDFAISYVKDGSSNLAADEPVMVRRSMADLKWLDETFSTQKVLGGTLCGRILPSFPPTTSHGSSSYLRGSRSDDASSTTSMLTHKTIKVAKKGVGKIRDAAKSLWGTTLQAGSYAGQMLMASSSSLNSPTAIPPAVAATNPANIADDASSETSSTTTSNSASAASTTTATTTTTTNTSTSTTNHHSSRTATGSKKPPRQRWDGNNFYNAQAPAAKARQLERYLNYLLEHPALSTSFPLNTILMASQSGLDAAKKALHDCAKANKEIREQTPRLDDGKLRLAVPFLSVHDAASDYGWVRTAAQAAIALRIHGMLETTGMPSASARLQHASLPTFPTARRWDDLMGSEHVGEGGATATATAATTRPEIPHHVGFEDGVVQVSSELRRGGHNNNHHNNNNNAGPEADFLGLGGGEHDVEGHGRPNHDEDDDDGYDLLPLPVPAPERRILMAGSSHGSSRHSASRTSASQETRFHYGSTSLPENFLFGQDDESAVLLGTISIDDNIDKLREVIGSVDNTLRRCLASGGGIGKVRRDRNSVQLDVVKGFDGWEGMRGQFISQRSLLKGVEGLAKSKEIYEEGDLILIDDLSWQSSLARSAVTAAEDVRSAVRASNTAANAKAAASNAAMAAQNACESGNFNNIEEARAAQTRASIAQSHAIHAAVVDHEAKSVKRRAAVALANDVKCWNVHRKRELLRSTLTYAKSQHEATRRAVDAWSSLRDGFIGSVVMPPLYDRRAASNRPSPSTSRASSSSDLFGEGQDTLGSTPRYTTDPGEVTATIYGASSTCESPPIVAVEHDLFQQPPPLDLLSATPTDFFQTEFPSPKKDEPQGDDSSDDDASKSTAFYETHTLLPFATASPIPEEQVEPVEEKEEEAEFHDSAVENPMTASMESLVDGLMNWGGAIDIDEELVLPRGMAASIAFEESAASTEKAA